MRLLERADELKHLADAEVGLYTVDDARDDARQTRQDGGCGDGVDARAHKFLLALHAADVALLIAVADVGDGGLAVHVLHTGAQIDDEPAVIVPRILVVHTLFDVDIDAANGVDDLLKGMGIDDDVVVDADAEEVLHRALRELFTAVRVGGVDLVIAVARDGDARVARDGEKRRLVFDRVDGGDHERIAASHIVCALVDAHNHDRRLVLCHKELFLVLGFRTVEQAALCKECASDGGEDEGDEDGEQDVRPSSFLRCSSFRW